MHSWGMTLPLHHCSRTGIDRDFKLAEAALKPWHSCRKVQGRECPGLDSFVLGAPDRSSEDQCRDGGRNNIPAAWLCIASIQTRGTCLGLESEGCVCECNQHPKAA